MGFLMCFYSWHAIIVDGHSVEELCKALSQARHQPTAIIAKTTKGKGIPGTLSLTWLLVTLYYSY
jgi:transketolase